MSYYNYEYNQFTTPEEPPKKEKKSKGKFIGKVIVAALVFGLVSGSVFYGVNLMGGAITRQKTKLTGATSGSVVEGTAVSTAVTVKDVSDIVKNAMPSIVQITNISIKEYMGFFGQIYQQQGESAGSGIIIAEDEDFLYIATNNHVISNSTELTIGFCDDEAVSAQLQGTYPESDVAVVKVEKATLSDSTLSAIKIASLGDSDNLSLGESSVVIGNSLGRGQSVTTGVISALEREVSINANDGTKFQGRLIQTDAAVNGGNSGGALINMKGEVVGIVNAKFSGSGVEGTGFAIPINRARTIIDQIISEGAYTDESLEKVDEAVAGNGAYLGIYGMDITSSRAASYNMPEGVYISQIVSGQAADKAGLAKGDIIIALDERVISTMAELQNILSYYMPGDEITLRVAKATNGYAEDNVKVVLGSIDDQ